MNKLICKVRVQTEAYKRGNTYFYGKSVREVKKDSEFLLLSEECQNIGVLDAMLNIDNLMHCESGIYWLTTSHESYDCESGYLDDWVLTLIPEENTNE